MNRKKWPFILILLSVLIAVTVSLRRGAAYIEPGLTDLNAPILSVIIAADDSKRASSAVEAMGGRVTSDLWLINGVTATIPTHKIRRLAHTPGVVSIVRNKPVYTAVTFPIDSPYAWDDWATDRRTRTYPSDVEFMGPLGSMPVPLPDGGAFALLGSGQALIMDPDGTVRTSFTLSGDFNDQPVVGSDGVIYVNARKTLYAINPDGSTKWDFTSELKFEGGLALFDGGDLLYAVLRDEEDHFFCGFDTSDGEMLFSTEVDEDNEELFHASQTTDSDGFAYAVDKFGELYKVKPDGDIDWSTPLPGGTPSSLRPQIGSDGTIYVPSELGWINAVNPQDGSLVYTFYREGGTILDHVAISSDGSVYAAFGDSHIYGIDPLGNEKFDYHLASHHFNYSPILTLDESQVVIAARESVVIALDAQTGSLNWQFETLENAELMDNPILAPNGNIHFGDVDGNYYILNPDGWRLYTNQEYESFINSPTITHEGTVFIHDNESYLVTLARLADSWDGNTPDVQPTSDPTVYRVLNPVSIDMGADILHENGIIGDGVTVAVVDSGVYFDDETQLLLGDVVQEHFLGQVDFLLDEGECLALSGTWEPAAGYCLTDEDNSQDTFGHGSHVAGIIWNNMTDYNTGVTLGVAPDASILSVRVLGDHGGGTYEDVIRGIQYVVANKTSYTPEIKVLNLSLTAIPTTPYFADPLNIAVEEAWAAGIVVVAAAGNSGPHAETITVPGNNPYVISVGAVVSQRTPGFWVDDSVAPWSATGPTYDGFFKPDLLAPGANVVSFMHNGSGDIPYLVQVHPDYSENTSLFRMNGTSMATAAASGAVALMLDHNPSLTPDQVKFRLLYTGQQTMNAYGEVIDNIFQQGAGRIWLPRAIYGDLPQDGVANVGMDIQADLSHGWETEEDIVFHYEGPVSKVLSDDGGVFLYYVDAGDGTAMALGAAEAQSGAWLNADELDDLAEVLPGGQMVWAGGQMVWAGGQMIWAGGQMVWAGGQMVWAGGQMVWAGGQLLGGSRPEGDPDGDNLTMLDDWIEGELVWSGSQVDWLGGEMTWEPGLVYWDGGQMNPSNTFSYSNPWVNDDGTVDPLPDYTKIYLPMMIR